MQTGSLFFRSLPDDLSSGFKKEFQDVTALTQSIKNETGVPAHSIFLSTLKQIESHRQGAGTDSSPFESELMASNWPALHQALSDLNIQGDSGHLGEWLNSVMNFVMGLPNLQGGNDPANGDGGLIPSAVTIFDNLAAAGRETQSDTPLSDSDFQTQFPGDPAETLIERLYNQILRFSNAAPIRPPSDRSHLPPTDGAKPHEPYTAGRFSELKNRIIDILNIHPSADPADTAPHNEVVVSNGTKENNPLFALVAGLLHWHKKTVSPERNFLLPQTALHQQSPDPDSRNNVQTLLVKLISYLQGGQKGTANLLSAPKTGAYGAKPADGLGTGTPKTNLDFQILDVSAEKIQPFAGDGSKANDQLTSVGPDLTRRIKPPVNGEIATAAKVATATRLKSDSAVSPSANQNQHLDQQIPRDIDAKGIQLRAGAVETAPSDTGTLSSEADLETQNYRHTGSAINSADGFARGDADGRASSVILESGGKASVISNNRAAAGSADTALTAKDSDFAGNFVRPGALDQIVERAALTLRNGQSEFRLHLKPEFLGQLHMRVVTENHQVTLKISTEYIAVKDFIENNIHQLKADLQNHGLEINSLDVSLTKDSHQHSGGNSLAGLPKANQNPGGRSEKEASAHPEAMQPDAWGGENDSDNTINYFA